MVGVLFLAVALLMSIRCAGLAAFLPAVLGAGQGSPEATFLFWQLGFISVHFSLSSCSALRRAESALAIGSGRF